jgi:hypothetical protein
MRRNASGYRVQTARIEVRGDAILLHRIVVAKNGGAAGNYVAIRHGRQYMTRYMHMKKVLHFLARLHQHFFHVHVARHVLTSVTDRHVVTGRPPLTSIRAV